MRHPLLFVICATLFLTLTAHADAQGKKNPKMPYWSDQKDAFGDPLPVGAIARIGTVRYRLPDMRGATPSPDGKLLAVLGSANDIEIIELPAWKQKRVITVRGSDKDNPGQLQGLAFSADGKKLVTCDINLSRIYLFDVANGKALKKLALPDKQAVNNPFLALLRDEQTLVCIGTVNNGIGASNQLIVWDLAKDKVRVNVALPIDQINGGRPGVTISADFRLLAQSIASENPNRPGRGIESRIELWDLTAGKLARKIELETPMPRLDLSPDGKWLAASNDSSLLRIYDTSTGKEQHNIRGRNSIQHLEFSPDGALFVADYLGNIQRWDAAKGERTATWKSPGRFGISHFIFPPQGNMLALAMQPEAVNFWEVETGKLFSPKDLPAEPIAEVAFSPRGDLFVATNSGTTAWWNPRTGVKLRDLKLESPDGEDREGSFFAQISWGTTEAEVEHAASASSAFWA